MHIKKYFCESLFNNKWNKLIIQSSETQKMMFLRSIPSNHQWASQFYFRSGVSEGWSSEPFGWAFAAFRSMAWADSSACWEKTGTCPVCFRYWALSRSMVWLTIASFSDSSLGGAIDCWCRFLCELGTCRFCAWR